MTASPSHRAKPSLAQKEARPSAPRLTAIGTANPPDAYTQQEALELFGTVDPKIKGLFLNSHIKSRRLCLPPPAEDGTMPEETALELYEKNRKNALFYGALAIEQALDAALLRPHDVDSMACVTSTGYLCPGLTAYYIKHMGFRRDVHRIDLVGMGCNGGLNGMQPVVNYCAMNPGAVGLLACVEICSAAYVTEQTLQNGVTNSLFGDAAAAAVFAHETDYRPGLGPRIFDFCSHIIPDAINAMRYDFDGNKYAFRLEKDIPYILGDHVAIPVDQLLRRHGLVRGDIVHWTLHSGGKKVIDAIKKTLNLTAHDVRHTQHILEELGNISSTAFLFAHKRLLDEHAAKQGERIVMITMGPGSTIETCLGQF